MSWDGSFVPFGNKSMKIVDQVVNFKLDYSMAPILLEIVSGWIGREIIVTMEGCVKMKGILKKVEQDHILILVISSGSSSGLEDKIKIDRIETVECISKLKPPKNFMM